MTFVSSRCYGTIVSLTNTLKVTRISKVHQVATWTIPSYVTRNPLHGD